MEKIDKKILIIEDDLPLKKILSDRLIKEGFEVIGAEDGEAGLSMALAEHPDLILLNNRLPKMDGITVMEKLREDAWGANVPIIILTNYEADDAMLKAIVKHRPSYYLVKTSWKLDDIVKKIKEVLGLEPKFDEQQ